MNPVTAARAVCWARNRGINALGIGTAYVKNFTFLPLAVAVASTIWPRWTNPSNWGSGGGLLTGTQWQTGLIMPDSGNNNGANIGKYNCFGAWIGLVGSEHCNFESVQILNTFYAVVAFNPGSVCHAVCGGYLSAESVYYVFSVLNSGSFGSSGNIGIQVSQTDVESIVTFVYDPSAKLYGGTNFQTNDFTAGYLSNQFSGSPASIHFRLVQEYMAPGPVSSPQAAPLTTVAWPNYYYRDAWITVALSTGTFTSLNIDSTAQPNAVGAGTYQFSCRPGIRTPPPIQREH